MPKRLVLLALLAIICAATIIATIDHYLFVRHISSVDPKALHHQIRTLIAARDERERNDAIMTAASSPELRNYRIAVVADHLVLLHTHSLTSDAYLAFHQLGSSHAWVVGWLRDGRFSQIGTFQF